MGEGDQGREHQGELSGRKHSALERCVVHYSKLRRSMSALGQKQTLHRSNGMSALPPKADMHLLDDVVGAPYQRFLS
jgi:hypothetical protein